MELSIRETATALGKSERQIRYLIRQGKLPAIGRQAVAGRE